jgi:hypothetical protein
MLKKREREQMEIFFGHILLIKYKIVQVLGADHIS